MSYFFTSDEHYGHKNIIKYCNRPFLNEIEMNNELIYRHNSIVGPNDVVVHIGDFTLGNKEFAADIIKQLKGQHIFLQGSHDRWLSSGKFLWEKTIEGQHVVACHYPMRSWPRSHYRSWQLFGHVHGRGEIYRMQLDVGVDAWDFYPVAWETVKEKLIDTAMV